jgi:hypothetical protein
MTSSPTYKDWWVLFAAEERRPEYGTFDKFDPIPASYLDNVDKLKDAVCSNRLKTIIVVPGPEQSLGTIHNCAIDDDKNRLTGIFGMNYDSLVKQTTLAALVKPFSPATTTRADASTTIPTIEDFLECSNGKDFLELTGSKRTELDKITGYPQSFWVHPHVAKTLLTSRHTKVDRIEEAYAVVIKGMDNTSATTLTK